MPLRAHVYERPCGRRLVRVLSHAWRDGVSFATSPQGQSEFTKCRRASTSTKDNVGDDARATLHAHDLARAVCDSFERALMMSEVRFR